METEVHSAKQKSGHHFHIPRKLHHSKMNEQSGLNVEQIEKDKFLECKTI
jgi:hypothetical protein